MEEGLKCRCINFDGECHNCGQLLNNEKNKDPLDTLEKMFYKNNGRVHGLSEKEQSKVKTAEEILKECTGHAYGLTSAMHIKAIEIYADQFKDHITKLEARNKELEERENFLYSILGVDKKTVDIMVSKIKNKSNGNESR